MKRRVLGIFLALLLAGVGAFVLMSYVRSAEQRALAGQEVTEVLVVSQPVAQGTPASQVEGSVHTELIPLKVKASDSISSLNEVEGTVTAVALVPGEQVLRSRFVSPEELTAQAQVDVPDDLLEVTVSLSPERAIGGQPKPGDTVAVIASFTIPTGPDAEAAQTEETGDATEEQTPAAANASSHLILHKVLVSNVQVERLPQEPEEGTDLEGYTPELAPTGNLLITLALDAPSVERVVFSAEHGSIWLALEPEGAPEDGTRIQSPVTIYE